jgi:hypothetical protein
MPARQMSIDAGRSATGRSAPWEGAHQPNAAAPSVTIDTMGMAASSGPLTLVAGSSARQTRISWPRSCSMDVVSQASRSRQNEATSGSRRSKGGEDADAASIPDGRAVVSAAEVAGTDGSAPGDPRAGPLPEDQGLAITTRSARTATRAHRAIGGGRSPVATGSNVPSGESPVGPVRRSIALLVSSPRGMPCGPSRSA